MKTKVLTTLIALAAFLEAAPQGWALPPRQRSVSGVISSIDYQARTLTLAPSTQAKPVVLAWKDSTRFVQGSSRICSGSLAAGQPVRVSYRREVGQLVPRQVSLRRDVPNRCDTRECCVKRS